LSTVNVYSVIGVEDGSFKGFPRLNYGTTLLCAVNMVGATIREIRFADVTIDGLDATDKLLRMVENIKFDAIILSGISFAGFNLIDAKKVSDKTKKPVIVYMGQKPDSIRMLRALKKLYTDWEERWQRVNDLGELYSATVKTGEPKIFYEIVGESPEWGLNFLKYSAMLCRIPEPVRVANLIAKGVTRSY
jgi:endonuclease V-like protein UPF0215 family